MIKIGKQMLRVIEKVPGINLAQYADFGDFKLAMTPKIGTRTIRDALIFKYKFNGSVQEMRNNASDHVHYSSRSAFRSMVENGAVTVVVRDPFERIYSCWKQKIWQRENLVQYFWMYYPKINSRTSFLDFLKFLEALPIGLMEKHFIPQSYYIPETNSCDAIKLDNLSMYLESRIPGYNLPPANTTKNLLMAFSVAEEFEYFNKKLEKKYCADKRIYDRAK